MKTPFSGRKAVRNESSKKETLRFYRFFCSKVASPVSLRCFYATFDPAFNFKSIRPRPETYANSEHFALDWAVYNYAAKAVWLDTQIDKEQAALLSESRTEDRLRSFNNRRHFTSPLIERARKEVLRIIGEGPGQFLNGCCHGPGVTFSVRGKSMAQSEKLTEVLSVTRFCLPWARAALATDYVALHARGIKAEGPTSLLDGEFNVVPGNRQTCVPKDAFTDRIIACEPTMNIYVQKGLGAVLRHRMKNYGIDLDDQSINQRLARDGSVDGSLSTLDLSSASDSVSYELVKACLPPRWFAALDGSRSACTLVDGTWRLNEKFSAMGCGFTFELESLLFHALCVAAGASFVSVYGDDIIVDTQSTDEVVRALVYAGFIVNEDKSFASGPFRESCGKHYFLGRDVTPPYQKELVNACESVYYRACNRFLRWLGRLYGDPYGTVSDQRFGNVRSTLIGLRTPRFLIPDGIGDGGLISEQYPVVYRYGLSYVKVLQVVAGTYYDPYSMYWDSLRSGSQTASYGDRGSRSVTRERVGRIFL